MAEHLNRQEHEELRQLVIEQKADIFINRHTARQFYTHVGGHNVRDLTGLSVAGHKVVVIGLLALAVLSIVTALYLIVTGFGWAAVVIVPLIGIFWTVIAGFTAEHGELTTSSALLALVAGFSFFLPPDYAGPIVLFAVSIFCYRSSHIAAQYYLTRLVLKAYDAFDMLSEHIEIVRYEQ